MPDSLIDNTLFNFFTSASGSFAIGAAFSLCIGLWLSFRVGVWLTEHGVGSRLSKMLKLSEIKFVEPSPKQFQEEHALAGFLVDQLVLPFRNQFELGSQLQIEHCSDEIMRSLPSVVETYINELMMRELPGYWPMVPLAVKRQIRLHTIRHARLMIDDLLEDLLAEMSSLWDMKAYISNQFYTDKELPKQFVQQVLQPDIKITSRKALPLALLGAVALYLISLSAHSISIQILSLMISFPVVAVWHLRLVKKYFSAQLQALQSMDRRSDINTVSKTYQFIGENFLKPHTIFTAMFNGRKRKRVMQLIRKHSKGVIDQSPLKTVIQVNEGFEAYATVKHKIVAQLPQLFLDALERQEFNQDRAACLERYLLATVYAQPHERVMEPVKLAIAQLQPHYIAVASLAGLLASMLMLALSI